MIKIRLQANSLDEYIDFCKMLNLYKCDYFFIHQPKKAYSTSNGMFRFYVDIAKIDDKNFKVNDKNEIVNVKTGKVLLKQRDLPKNIRGRKSKHIKL